MKKFGVFLVIAYFFPFASAQAKELSRGYCAREIAKYNYEHQRLLCAAEFDDEAQKEKCYRKASDLVPDSRRCLELYPDLSDSQLDD